MKKRYFFMVFLYVFLSLGCQHAALVPQTPSLSPKALVPQTPSLSPNEWENENPKALVPQTPSLSPNEWENKNIYNKIIKGGLGFDFGVIDTTQLKEKGFRKKFTSGSHRYASDVGTWKNTRDNKDEFFNFSVEVVVSPLSSTVKLIKGIRLYGFRRYPDHFASCMDDYRAITTQLKIKYPTLVHATGAFGAFEPNEYSSSSYYEGAIKSKRKYSGSVDYVGRSVILQCSKQKLPYKASLLIVKYYESSEKNLYDEQKKVFKESSEKSLEKKGLGKDRL